MHRFLLLLLLSACAVGFLPTALTAQPRPLKTENVFLIMSDGLRWQEVFSGAEEALMNSTNGGVKNAARLTTNFWRNTPELRRSTLLPFMWGEIARHGQIYGNPAKGSRAAVANTRRFSYPGYNEVLSGFADPAIDSNDKKPNPNTTVFEWLHEHRPYRGRVAVFATWDVFPFIFNVQRSGLPIWPPWERRFESKLIHPPVALVNLLQDTTEVFPGVILDSFLSHVVLDHIPRRKPRLAFIGFGETDEWAHAGRYDLYLEAAHNFDRFVHRLWDMVQGIPQYRNKTTFILTADHGRGSGLSTWKDHGEKIPESDALWIAAIGPDTRPLGERFQTGPVTLGQVASTIAALLGKDFQSAFPKATPPITDLVGF